MVEVGSKLLASGVVDIDALIVGDGTALVPVIKLLECTPIDFPLILVPGLPSVKAAPSKATSPPPSSVGVWPSVVKTESGRFPNGIVDVPTMGDPEGFNEIGLPLVVRPGCPGATLVPATARPVGFAMSDWPPSVKTGEWS